MNKQTVTGGCGCGHTTSVHHGMPQKDPDCCMSANPKNTADQSEHRDQTYSCCSVGR